jgi:hypothetical protein
MKPYGRRVRQSNREGGEQMATYRDPIRMFAPLEVIERLLEMRAEAGYEPTVYLCATNDLTAYFDAYGFDVYALADDTAAEFHYGRYRAPLAPGGDYAHEHPTAH